jgi:hypothetical protein
LPRLEAGFTVSDSAWVWFEALQWSAMAVTLLASWLVASKRDVFRARGFWVFLLSNVLWLAWGWHTGAWALVVLQAGLAAMNIRGASQNAE